MKTKSAASLLMKRLPSFLMRHMLTISSLDSLWMSSLMETAAWGWHGKPGCWVGEFTELWFLRHKSLDLNGTMDSWLTLGIAADSSKETTLSRLVNSTTAWTPWGGRAHSSIKHKQENPKQQVKLKHMKHDEMLIYSVDKHLYLHNFHKRSAS